MLPRSAAPAPAPDLFRHIGPVSVGRNCSCCSGPTHCMKVRVATDAAYRTCTQASQPPTHAQGHNTAQTPHVQLWKQSSMQTHNEATHRQTSACRLCNPPTPQTATHSADAA